MRGMAGKGGSLGGGGGQTKQSGVVVHACDPSTLEAEIGRSHVQGQSMVEHLPSKYETLSSNSSAAEVNE
jgi:hypothetical protein